MSQTDNYTRTAIGLHWLIAIAIVATFGVGFYMHDLPLTPEKLKIYSWHKWAGVTIFMVVWFRLIWRFIHRPPGPPVGMPAWQHVVAELAHRFIYILMIAIPVSGWLMSSAKGFQTVYFGVLPLADLLTKDKELGSLLAVVHTMLNFTLIGLVMGHAGAAIKHHFIDRDDVLIRMLPFIKKF
jgi:cytochrome b561